VVVVLLALPVAVACADDYPDSETARWLRIAGNFDESPEQVACVEQAMHDLLTEEELDLWLSQDPETVTVEQVQALPRAIEVADRCRHLTDGE
jgi:hypothetical protein